MILSPFANRLFVHFWCGPRAGRFLESIGFEAFGDFLKLDPAMYSTSRALDDDAATDDENDTDDEDVSKHGMSSSSAQRDSMIVSTTPRTLPHHNASALDFPSPALASSASSSSSSSSSASSKPAAVVRVRAPSIETLGAMRRLVEERAAQMRRRWTEVVRLPVPGGGAGGPGGDQHAYAWRAVAGVSHADEIGRRPTMEVCLLPVCSRL
jgi:hypothetical protein